MKLKPNAAGIPRVISNATPAIKQVAVVAIDVNFSFAEFAGVRTFDRACQPMFERVNLRAVLGVVIEVDHHGRPRRPLCFLRSRAARGQGDDQQRGDRFSACRHGALSSAKQWRDSP